MTTKTLSSRALHEKLRHLKETGAPPFERHQAFVEWFRACIREGNSPDRLRRDAPTWSERFDAYAVDGLDGCLVWDGPYEKRATGRTPVLTLGGSTKNARLYALQRAGVEVPMNRRVLPSCGNRDCVRVEHLVVEAHHWARHFTPAQMLVRLQVMALRLGETPSARRWTLERGKPSSSWYQREFGTWDEAVAAAGLQPVQRQQPGIATTRADCVKGLRALRKKLNRPPSTHDVQLAAEWLRQEGHPASTTTYKKYLAGNPVRWKSVLEAAGIR